jgi:antitoxin VapB
MEHEMPLFIKDEQTARLVNELAQRRGTTKQDAVKFAVQAELARETKDLPLREKLALWHKLHPLPPATGKIADKAFFDDLSGEP